MCVYVCSFLLDSEHNAYVSTIFYTIQVDSRFVFVFFFLVALKFRAGIKVSRICIYTTKLFTLNIRKSPKIQIVSKFS